MGGRPKSFQGAIGPPRHCRRPSAGAAAAAAAVARCLTTTSRLLTSAYPARLHAATAMAAIERAVKELGQRAEALVLQAGHADPGTVTHKAERSATFTEDFTDPSRPVDDLLDSTFASRYVSQPMAKDR